jgi:hypothetical protein
MARAAAGKSPAQIQKFLKGQEYPAEKQELISTAKKNKAPDEVMQVIAELPKGEFSGPQDVMKAYGQEQ